MINSVDEIYIFVFICSCYQFTYVKSNKFFMFCLFYRYKMSTIGQRIKQMRAKLALTQQQLADEAGISRNALAMYEVDKQIPREKALLQLADTLNTTADWLRDGSSNVIQPSSVQHDHAVTAPDVGNSTEPYRKIELFIKDSLANKAEEAASVTGRSLHAEIITRLESTLSERVIELDASTWRGVRDFAQESESSISEVANRWLNEYIETQLATDQQPASGERLAQLAMGMAKFIDSANERLIDYILSEASKGVDAREAYETFAQKMHVDIDVPDQDGKRSYSISVDDTSTPKDEPEK